MTPRILALDTTSEYGSLALLHGEEVAAEVEIHSKTGFSHILYPRLEELLAAAGCGLSEIDCFAAAAGPGSFTGVRVGLAAIKGLAEAVHRPAVAVSNLQAIAWHGTRPLRAPVIDAHREQVYAALYDGALNIVSPEVVTPLAEWLERLPSGGIEFLATDAAVLASARVVPRARAVAVARIAAARFAEGKAQDPAALDANYVRRSDAELFWKGP